MFDIDEIRKQALASMRETMEKNEERISKIEVPSSEKAHLCLPPKWKNRLPLILNVK